MMITVMKKFCLALLALLAVAGVNAQKLDVAQKLVTEGDYWKAALQLEKDLKGNPALAKNAQYNYLSGVCSFEMGNIPQADRQLTAAYQKGMSAASLYLGRIAFFNYEFDKAADFYDEFRKYREKVKKDPGDDLEQFERELAIADNSLDRVEKIVIIDSIAVPSDNFFEHYKLPRSAGKIISPKYMPLESHRSGAVAAFVNEGEDYMIWGEPDSIGNVKLVESYRMTDGVWQDPVGTPDFLRSGGYADYPFVMPDGVTIYYASDGDESMGGYDIFVVTRDPQTGEFLQPRNLGMPFNSPYDDFMMAIDEENGIGWWATDRNQLGDKVTIYVYKVNDSRSNYDPDDENLAEKARISDFKSTQADDAEEVAKLLDLISSIDPNAVSIEDAEFYLPKPGGGLYTKYDELPGGTPAQSAARRYFKAVQQLAKEEDNLKSLRLRYHRTHADNVKQQIIGAEKDIRSSRIEVSNLRSDLYSILKK